MEQSRRMLLSKFFRTGLTIDPDKEATEEAALKAKRGDVDPHAEQRNRLAVHFGNKPAETNSPSNG